MKTLSLDLDLKGLNLSAEDQELKPAQVVKNVINNIMLHYAQQKGCDEKERRQYNKILDALDSAKKKEIELDDEWFGFLRKCKREAKMVPTTVLHRVEVLIDAVKYK